MWGSQFWLSASGAPASFNSNCSPNQTQQTETQGGVQFKVHQGELLLHDATIFARCCRLARQRLPSLRLEDIGEAQLNGNISSHDWIQRGLLQFASQTFNETDSCIMCRCAWDFSPKNMVGFFGQPGPSLFTRASPEYITPLHPSLEGQVHLGWNFSHDLLADGTLGEVLEATEHSFSFTAEQCCSAPLNNRSRWRLVLKCT